MNRTHHTRQWRSSASRCPVADQPGQVTIFVIAKRRILGIQPSGVSICKIVDQAAGIIVSLQGGDVSGFVVVQIPYVKPRGTAPGPIVLVGT